MALYARLFNGQVLEFPDDTPDEVVHRVAQEEVSRLRAAQQPVVAEPAPQPVARSTERTFGESVKDIGAGLLSGTGAALAFPGQVVSLVPGLREAGQALASPGEALSQYAQDLKSEGLKAREAIRSQALSEAEKEGVLSSFATAITSTLKDPALISTFLAEQLPLLLPPLAAARVTQMAGRGAVSAAGQGLSGDAARLAAEEAAKQVNRRAYAAAVGTGATMQGADISSGAYQRAYDAAIQQGMSPEEAADAATGSARIAGAGAFGTSLLTQRLPGARAIEERMARLPGTSGRVRAGVGEATSEGLEETGGALFQNIGVRQVDPTVALTEGVGAAAGLGVLGGGFFGTLLGKRGKESLAPGQREGESLEQTINRLSAERAQLMPQELEQQFPNAQQLIEMVNKNPEQGYSTIVKYIEQFKTQPDSPEKEQALQTAEEIRQRLSVEDIERQIPSQQNVIPDKDLRNLGFSRQDPLYQELVGKDLVNPADAKAVVDYLKAELQKENLPERRQTVVADMLTTVDQYLSTMPGSGFYVGEIDTAGVGAGAGVVQQPGRQSATAVGATERDGVAPAGEPVPKPVARTERQQPALVFETSKGSIYAVDADGKTSRTKRSPGRGQNETYPPHEAFYVSTSDADRLLDAMRTPEGRSIRLGYRDGNLFRSIQNRSEIPDGAQPFIAVLRKDNNQLVDFVSAELTPRLGLAPVEKLYTPDGVSSTHIGHPIVKIGKGRQAQVQNPVTEETLAQYGIKPASAVAKRILGKSQDDPKVQEELAKLKPQKPAEKPSEKPAGTTEEVDESLKLDGEAIFGTHKVAGLPIQYMLVKALKLSKDVPQFKSDADENGVVQKLTGKFDWRDLGPLQVWQRKNGDFEIISGRHRFDLAKANNIQYLPVQIHKEADGFDVIQAKTLDAELNIRDGYGKVKDYVNYFQGTQLTREEAKSRNLLEREAGRRGFDIANNGSPEIIAAHRADRISDQDAALVANAAPQDGRLQAVGLKVLEIDKKNGQSAVNTIKGVKAVLKDQGEQAGSVDMFGFDSSLMQEAEELASIATRKQDEISRRIAVLSGVTKNPKIAAQEGIDVKDPDAVKKRIAELRKQRSEWDRWETNPDLIAQMRQERGGAETRTPALFAQEIAEGKQLTSPADVQYYQNNADAIEAELKKLQDAAAAEAQDQMFSLRPEEMEARYRELEARAKREEPAQPATVTTPPDERALAIQRRVAAIDAQLKDFMGRVLSKYGLQNVGIELVKDMQANGEYANQLIRLADNHPNPLLHLRHESVHALKELDFFTPQQWATLEQRAKDEWIETYLKNVPHKDNKSRYDAYTDLFKEQGKSPAEAEQAMIEEAIADAFSYFQKAKPPAGFLASINNRIKNFFKAIKEFLIIGNLTAEDIFGKIEAGQLRPLNDKNPAPAAEPPKLSLRNVPQIDRERSLNNKRISPRFPTAVKATEETLGPVRLQPDLDTFKRDPVAFKYNVGLMSEYPNFTDIKGTADQRAEQMINRMRDNLLWLYKHWNQDLSNRSKLWYVGGNRIAHRWAEKYGIPPETAAAIIAALSPQKDWFQNVSLAERTLDALIFNADTRWDASMDRVFKERAWTKKFPVRQYRGKTLKEMYVPGDPKSLAKMAVWIRAWDEGHNPQTARVITPEGTFTNEIASGKTGKPVAMRAQSFAAMVKTLQILQDSDLRNFSELIGKNHKVRSFYNNIIAPFAGEDVTIDTHAVAAALMRPLGSSDLEVYHNFGSAKPAKKDKAGNILVPASKGTKNSAVTGLYGTYAMYAEAYRRAAADAGILPREMQSITWEAIRGLFRPEQKQAKLKTQVNVLWNNVAKGKLSGQEAREQISKLVSGIEDPAWVKSPAGSNDSRTDSSYATELSGAGVSGREPERVPSRAGERAARAVPKLSIRAQTQTSAPEEINVDGKMRSTFNSFGQPIHSTEEGVKNFWRWFGDSAMVDNQGRPIVVYHGGAKTFKEIKENQGLFGGIFVRIGEPSNYRDVQFPLYLRGPVLDLATLRSMLEENETVLRNALPAETDANTISKTIEALTDGGYYPLDEDVREAIRAVDDADAQVEIQKLRGKVAKELGFEAVNTPDEFEGETVMVLGSSQIKSAADNIGTFSPIDPNIRKSIRAQTQTPEFKEWFGDSKIVDSDGNPKVMYHGTARDITVFRPKQANAIFVTEDPRFAESFSDLSQEYMRRELFNNLDDEEKLKLISESADEAYQNNEIDEQTRDEIKREYAESPSSYGLIYESIEQYAHQKINDMLPSRANILPVFVKSENPFDFENSDHIEKLRPAVKNGLISNTTLQAIRYGYWENIESGSVQKAIRQAGFDGFYVNEGMQKNLAVFNPTQIKSAIGNIGTFSQTDPDIRKSLRSELTNAERDLRVRWTDERINKLVRAYGVNISGRYKDARGFAAAIKPDDFLRATASPEQRQQIAAETAPLDPDKLAQEDQELFLEIAPTDEEGVYQIKNHEGRHRMTALMNAGYNGRIPVVLMLNRKNAETEEEVYLRPQQFRVDKELITAPRGIFIPQMIPINAESREELREVFGGEADLKFSLRSPQQSLRNTLPPTVWNRVDDTIGVRDQKSWPQRIMDAISPSNWSTFRENALNRYNELAVYDREYIRQNGGARLMADESAEAAALMSDLGGGLTAAAFGVNDRIGGIPVYKNGLVRIDNLNGTVKGPLPIFAPLAAYNNPEIYRLYQFWVTAQRGERYNALGKKTPFTQADMQAVQDIEKQYPEFRSIHNEWIKYNNGLVDFAVQAGVLTPGMAAEFKKHGDYFPMYKYMEDDVVTGPKTFVSIANVPIPKKFKGDEVNPMGDFFENVIRNSQSLIQAGIKNIAAQKATKIAEAIGQVRPLGYNQTGPGGATIFVPAKPATMLANYYRVLVNGEERYYAAADMKFINAIKALNIPDLPFIGLLSGPANVLRNLVTKTPDFMMANMLRDSLSAWATSGTNILPIVSTIRNFGKAIANKSPELNMLVNTGVIGGYDYSQGVEMSAKIFAQDLRKIAGARTTMEKLTSPATSVWDALEKGSSASDAATRMEVYKKVLDETGNEAEAVFRALEVMNFNRKGRSAIVRILTAAVPFLNARMQGLDVLYRAGIRPIFAKDATPYEQQIAKSFWVRGMTIMALSAMYWAMTHDDDEYKKQEQETRDNYWLIPSMGIKIPIPFEVGVMFKVIPERVLELSFGSDTGKDFVNSMVRQLTSTFAFNPIPQTFLPIVEAATNYSFFTQRPIIGQGLENIAAPYQAAPTTSRTATGLADAYNAIIDGLPANVKAKIAASPMIVDQLIQGYTGSMGMYAVMAIDGVISANSDIPNATKRFEQMPVIRRFAIDPQARGTVTSFYDLKNSIDQVVRTANLLERTGKYDEYVKYVQENAGALSMRGYVNSLEKTMKEMREMKTRIRSSTIDADTKRDQLTAIQELENSLTSNIQTVKKTL